GATRKSPKGWGVGVHTHRFDVVPAWHDGDDAAFTILVSHQDQVEKVAKGAEVLAGSDFCENAVTQLGNHILTFQGHPEFVPGYLRALMEFRRDLIGEDTYTRGIASLAQEHQGERVARWVLNFLE
ncbi:MAG: GMP synthase, partial [Halioglobus sp.]